MTKRSVGIVLGIALLVLPVSACGEELDDVVEGAGNLRDKAAACAEALGITVDFDPAALSPERLAEEAEVKAEQARELGNKVAEQDLRDTLFAVADGYAELKQKQAERAADFGEWLRRQAGNLDKLRQVCL